jgi:hypothetical protein
MYAFEFDCLNDFYKNFTLKFYSIFIFDIFDYYNWLLKYSN